MIQCTLRELRHIILDTEEQWDEFQERFGPYDYERTPGLYIKISSSQLKKIGYES